MSICGGSSLRRAGRWLAARFSPSPLILMYHRIAELPSDPYELCVTPQHFVEQLEVLCQYGQPMRLQQLVELLQAEDLPRRAIVVTFDDGYADNLYNAKPLLERYDVPATVFVTTGYVGCIREFWWDELERLLSQPEALPATLSLNVNGHAYQWKLSEEAPYKGKMSKQLARRNTSEQSNPYSGHSLHGSLYQLLYPRHHQEKWQVLAELLAWTGEAAMVRPTHRMLSLPELIDLAAGELVEVGAHTMTHPVLATLPLAMQWHEIQASKAYLEETLCRQVTSFSYPHGSHTVETIAAVREAGFTCACSGLGAVRGGADYFRLPRLIVGDWDGETFARWLRSWLGD